jgi:superinfection exclusion protein B
MSVVEAVLSAIGQYSWRPMFGVWVTSGVILFFSEQLGIREWARSYRGWLIVGFIVSGSILLTYVWSQIYPWIADHVRDIRMRRLGKGYLNSLTPDEQFICKAFVRSNGESVTHSPANGAVSALLLKSILFTPGVPHSNGMREYRMQQWALVYLNKHPDLLQ